MESLGNPGVIKAKAPKSTQVPHITVHITKISLLAFVTDRHKEHREAFLDGTQYTFYYY